MADALASIRSGFAARSGVPPWVLLVAVRAPRWAFAGALALAPALGLLAVALLAPPAVAEALTLTRNVHDAFARFLTAVTTASAIAVSVAALTLRRELHGLGTLMDHHERNRDFRARAERQGRRGELPVKLPGFLAEVARATADAARRARDAARPEDLARSRHGVRLGDFLDAYEERLDGLARRLDAAGSDPDEALVALLDLETEVAGTVLRAFSRDDAFPEPLRGALSRLDETFVTLDVGAAYAKTLSTQWGLSRMSRAILVTALPAVVGSALMVLVYGEGAIAALGTGGAAALVCGALALALFPLAAFVSYLLRFVLINQHTLPTTSFLLGPDDERLGGEARR